MKFFPSKIDFFELFHKAVDNANRATEELVNLMENFHDSEAIAHRIHEIEREGDLVTHDIIRQLHQTFITPIDREDIHRLAACVDDVVDLVWACVDKMVVFRLEQPTQDAVHLARELHDTTRFIQRAFRDLEGKNYDHVKEHCIEINRLENHVDRLFRNALGDLFDDFKDDPVTIIKWKDIYERLEDATDKCEDVANILEGIVLKHA